MFKYITSFHSEVVTEGRVQSRPSLSVVPKEEEPLRIEPWLRKALDEQKLRRKAAERRRYYAGQ